MSLSTTRWVKTKKDGKAKARLVVRGFEEDFIMPRDSPTVGKGAMRTVLAIAASMKWVIKTPDIKSAFLQDKELDREVYLRPPVESHTPSNIIWKLKHGLYGLKGGARQFVISVKEKLLKLGFKQWILDPAIFYVRKDEKLRGIICCHVDVFLHSGDMYWAVQGSRPDLAFEMIAASTKLKQATVGDLTRTIKMLNRLKDFTSYMLFPCLNQELSDLKIMVITDASLGNINDGTGSTGAYIVWLADGTGLCCPLAWHASKIKRVVRSTIAAEALSLQEGLEEGFYYRTMVEEILGIPNKTIPIKAYTDNKSVIEAVFSTKLVDDKRLRVDIAAI